MKSRNRLERYSALLANHFEVTLDFRFNVSTIQRFSVAKL